MRRLAELILSGAVLAALPVGSAELPAGAAIALPLPRADSTVSVEQALRERRSIRVFGTGALTLSELGQLLWAAQGVTAPGGQRTAPSAGARYPLELRVVVGRVAGLEAGVYRYVPGGHELRRSDVRDVRPALTEAALRQRWVQDGAALLVISAQYRRSTAKYGQRGVRYAHLEAGHAAQNVSLEATALGLATVVVGAFDDAAVARALRLDAGEEPLVLMPLGRRADSR